jgi:hypothetical protein
MTARLASALTRTLAVAARLLPADRRPWAEALRAEADQIPAGGPRLAWLAGGFWLIAKEGGMARKIGYWTGAAAIAAAVALVIWLSWRAAGPADPESVTDRVRVLVGGCALAALPWVARRRSLFGPVADSGVARLVRIGSCAAICAMGLGIVRADRHAGINGVVGSGQFSWLRETAGLAVLIAAFAVPLVLKARRPLMEPAACWMTVVIIGFLAFVLVPMQAFAVGLAALVFAATSRRSAVTVASWTVGLIASLPTAIAACTLPFVLGDLFSAMVIVALVATGIGGCTGALAAWLVPEAGSPDELHAARIRHGAHAGAIAGTAGGLAAAAFSPMLGEMIILGLLAGLAGGVLGASITAHLRARSTAADLSALQPELQ